MGARRPRALTLLAGLALAGGLTVLAAGPASAHALLVVSVPADGTSQQVAPNRLQLHFTESVERPDTRVVVTDGLGRPVPLGEVQVVRGTGTGSPSTVLVPLPVLAPDVYRVAWRTLSSDDLHATSGVLVFGVRRTVAAAAPAAAADPSPPAGEVALRWLTLLMLATALGAGGLLALLRASAGTTDAVRHIRLRLLRLAQGALVTALLSSAGLLVVQAGSSRGPAAALGAAQRVLLHTGYGARWGLRAAGAVLLLAAATALRRRVRRGQPLPQVAYLAAGLLPPTLALGLGNALIGHAGAAASPTRVAAAAVHGLAAMVWTGSVVAAAVGLVTVRGADTAAIRRAVLRRVGAVAAGCLLLLVVTGLLLAADSVASVDALLFSLYGRALLVKLGLALAAGLLGLGSTLALRPALARRLVGRSWPAGAERRLVGVEAAVVVLLLAAAAALASSAPATGRAWRPAPTASGPVVSGTVADIVESLGITPNRPGRTFLTVSVLDTRRPAPAPVTGVTVTLQGPDDRPVRRSAQPGTVSGPVAQGSPFQSSDGWVVAGDDISAAGRWQIAVAVHRPGLPDAVASYDWVVAGGPPGRPVRVSAAPLALPLRVLAGLVALLGLASTGYVLGLVRRRRLPTALAEPVSPQVEEPVGAGVRSG